MKADSVLRVYENAYLQREEGSISDAQCIGITRLMIDFTDMTAFTPLLDRPQALGSDDFAAYLESQIISTPAKRPIIQRSPD